MVISFRFSKDFKSFLLVVICKSTFFFFFIPQKVTFKAGPQLQFLFFSDGSNNEWGFKFTVTAFGLPDIALSWSSDLQLLVARLLGRLASRSMAMKSTCGEIFNIFLLSFVCILQALGFYWKSTSLPDCSQLYSDTTFMKIMEVPIADLLAYADTLALTL